MRSICMVRWCKGGGEVGSRKSGDGSFQGENRCWMSDVGCWMSDVGICWPIPVLKKFAYNRTKSQTGTFFGLRTPDFGLPTPNSQPIQKQIKPNSKLS